MLSDDPRSVLRQAVLGESLHLSIPSRPELVERLTMLLKDRAEASGVCPEDRTCGLVTSLSEAITNAIVHGNLEIPSSLKEEPGNAFGQMMAVRCGDPRYAGRMVDVSLQDDGTRCVWTIADEGRGFDVHKLLARLEREEPETELASGRGVLLMKAFMDDVTWANGGRVITLVMDRRDPGAARRQARLSVAQALRAIPVRPNGTIDFDAAFAAVATNVSADGVGLLKSGPEHARRLLLELRDGDQVIYVPAQVCHVSPSGGDMVQIGCRIGASTDARRDPAAWTEAVDRLVAEHSPVATEHEARQHPRVVYARPVEVHMPGTDAPLAAMARDLSRTGLAFVLDAELPRGTVCALVLEAGTPTPVRLRARLVRTSHISDRFFDYGAQFVE
jgi:anti-sigma regulatory factor (Ser/Thr protein kinase)